MKDNRQYWLDKGFKIYDIETHSDEWFEFRTTGTDEYAGGYGSSEVGNALGMSMYRPSNIELFHHKIGTHFPEKFDNKFAFFGRALEQFVVDVWEFYDGSDSGFMELYDQYKATGNEGLKVRRANIESGYLVNPKYPWLFSSLDSSIPEGSFRVDTGEELETTSPLEIKNISYFAAKKYEIGIPTKYLAQVHQQMIVTESDYSEIAVLMDGHDFDVKPIPRSEQLADRIISETEELWNKRIIPARKLLREKEQALAQGDTRLIEKIEGEIQHLEPAVEENDTLSEFLSENFKKEKERMKGSIQQYNDSVRLKNVQAFITALNSKKSYYSNLLKKFMSDNHTEYLDFGDKNGYLRYYQKEGQKAFQLGNQVKHKVDKDLVESILADLDFNI